jgi:hypothetical protein
MEGTPRTFLTKECLVQLAALGAPIQAAERRRGQKGAPKRAPVAKGDPTAMGGMPWQ